MGNLRVPLIRLSIAGALIAAAGWPTHSPGGVLGEDITPYATLSSSYDSNLFLRSEDEDVDSDVITRITAGVDAKLQIGRQRVLLRAQANQNWFSRFDFLNYTGGKGALQWDWVLGEQWTGKLGYLYERTPTGFSQFRAPERDLLTLQTAIAEGDYKLHPRWEIRTAFDWRSVAHSRDVNESSDLEIYSGRLGLHYRTQKGPSIGTEAVIRAAEYPNRAFAPGSVLDNAFVEQGIGLASDYQVTGRSKFRGVLGYTQLRHEHLADQDFSDFTGRLGYEWDITGHTSLQMAVWREINPIDGPDLSFALEHGVLLELSWKPTAKLTLAPHFAYGQFNFEDGSNSSPQNNTQRDDTERAIGIKLGYRPIDKVELSVEYQNAERDSTSPSIDYQLHRVTGLLRLAF